MADVVEERLTTWVASVTIDIDSFDCDDLGDSNVTLTATDVNGNVNTGIAVVT